MTVCAEETTATPVAGEGAAPPGPDGAAPLVMAAGGGYAARLVAGGAGWYPERWTLDGPEPYTVPLPGERPERADSQLLALADGRVLIARPDEDGRHHCALLYPSGPDTGEQRLGVVEAERLAMLPPAPDGRRAYALAVSTDPRSGTAVSEVWLLCGESAVGPRLVARLDGRCAGGAWLDRDGGLLALNRTDAAGRTRAVAVPVTSGGDAGILLQIGEQSNDRLLLADPDSGLLLIVSDAPGEDRIGWGVLGSHRPVRFPDSLRPEGLNVSPLAIQPGRTLLPETCGVALRVCDATREWVAVWRPQQRALQHYPVPPGWARGAARWTEEGELLLPYATQGAPCGVARIPVPVPEPRVLSLSGWGGGEEYGGLPGSAVSGPQEGRDVGAGHQGAADGPPATADEALGWHRPQESAAIESARSTDTAGWGGSATGRSGDQHSAWDLVGAEPADGYDRPGAGEGETSHDPRAFDPARPTGAVCRPVPLHLSPQARVTAGRPRPAAMANALGVG